MTYAIVGLLAMYGMWQWVKYMDREQAKDALLAREKRQARKDLVR